MFASLLHRLNPFWKTPHLAVVFVEYNRQRERTSDQTFALLQQYLAALQGWRITYLRVDNRDQDQPLKKTSRHLWTVGGDNRAHEFSGWQRGINVLAAQRCPYDLALIINDMFEKPGSSFLQDYATPELLQKSITEHQIIGRIDSTGQHYTLFGYDVSSWICTNCFLVPKQAIDALGNMVLAQDRVGEIFPPHYNPRHLIRRQPLALASDRNNFSLACDLPPSQRNELRIKFAAPVANHAAPQANDDRPLLARIDEITLNNQALPENSLGRGLVHDQAGALWAEQSFSLALPPNDGQAAPLVIKGSLPAVTRQNIFPHGVQVVVYNDALLYQAEAPINQAYQRWIVEWLTERWHSRFDINPDTWELFKTKATAIFNEALLTAKFKELGYPPASYGQKIYY